MATRDTKFLLKRSNVPGKIPPSSALTEGEIALNTADAIIYTSGSTQGQILPIGWDRVHRTGDTMTGTLYVPTISASTYQNLPTDIRVTGGTYSNGTATFTNNTGGTFNISGFFTGSTDIYSTGFTYSNNTFTISQSSGSSLTTTINSVTGLTVNGSLSVTGTTSSGTISATTYQNLPTDIRVTGGTYTAGTATFTNNTGGTFNVTGFTNNYWQYRQAYQGFHATAGLSGSAFALPLVANQLTAFPIDVKIRVTISELVVGNVGASAGASVWGLYDSSNGLPNNLIFQTTAFNNATTGAVVYTISPTQTLSPSIYWVVYHSNSTPSYRVMQVANSFPNVIGENGANFNGSGTYLFRSTAYSATLPNPFGATSLPVSPSALMPFIQFKLV